MKQILTTDSLAYILRLYSQLDSVEMLFIMTFQLWGENYHNLEDCS